MNIRYSVECGGCDLKHEWDEDDTTNTTSEWMDNGFGDIGEVDYFVCPVCNTYTSWVMWEEQQ